MANIATEIGGSRKRKTQSLTSNRGANTGSVPVTTQPTVNNQTDLAKYLVPAQTTLTTPAAQQTPTYQQPAINTQPAAVSQPAVTAEPAVTAQAAAVQPSQVLYEDYLSRVGNMPTFNYSDFNYEKYKGAYDDLISAATDKLMNFQYNPDEDVSYQTYKDYYTNAGQQAQEDTLAKLASRTGGMANSYAVSAAQQQYNNYMQALNNRIPELEQMARDVIQNELATYQGLDATDYDRYLNDRTVDYNTWVQNADNAYRAWQTEADKYNQELNYYLSRAQAQEEQEALDQQYARDTALKNLSHQQAVELQNLKNAAAMQQQQAKQNYELELARLQAEQAQAEAEAASKRDLASSSASGRNLNSLTRDISELNNSITGLNAGTYAGAGSPFDILARGERLYEAGALTDLQWDALQKKYRTKS